MTQLARLFDPNILETIALQHFGIPAATVNTLKSEAAGNVEAFKRELLFRCKNANSDGNTRQVDQSPGVGQLLVKSLAISSRIR